MTTKLTIEATNHRILLTRQTRPEGNIDHQEVIEKGRTEMVWLKGDIQVAFAEVSDDFTLDEGTSEKPRLQVVGADDMKAEDPYKATFGE